LVIDVVAAAPIAETTVTIAEIVTTAGIATTAGIVPLLLLLSSLLPLLLLLPVSLPLLPLILLPASSQQAILSVATKTLN
jgi:hypothetical protein